MSTVARTCLVADDHPALGVAVCDYLTDSGYQTLGPAPDGRHAVALAGELRPDLAVVDWRMPKLFGADLLAGLLEAAPAMRIVIYTAEADEVVARSALAAGAAALVLKEAPLADLSRALDAAESGGAYVDAGVMRISQTSPLTRRELDVLALIADGHSHQEVGRQLGIGAETVRTHMKKACVRLNASTRTQAVAAALRLGLIA